MRQFMIGTDWWDDCDDAVALRVLARAHKDNEIRIAGIAINACMEQSVSSLSGFLTAESVGDIPIGLDRESTDYTGRLTYQSRLSQLEKRLHSNDEAADAVKLYRKVLSESAEPIEALEIGFLQAVAQLLESRPDEISPLSGMELVAQKVKKFWVMAGRWDVEQGRENNFARNERARNGAHIFCEKCPVPVTFLGWEVGNDVITGSKLAEDDILHKVLSDHGSAAGRKSWDPMLAVLAIIGNEKAAGYRTVHGKASVDVESGINRFVPDDGGLHAFVVKEKENAFYANMIDERIQSVLR